MLGLLVCLPATVSGQQDPRLVSAVRLAQEGQSDSARKVAGRLLVSLEATDSLYPEVLYTLGILAATEEERRLYLRRVIVDHSVSPWADDALLSMVQLEYATGNTEGAARDAERLVRDYPGSPLASTAALWGARAAGDRRDGATACRIADAGLLAVGNDVELRNQLEFQRQRCAGLVAMAEPAARPDSAAAQREAPRGATPPPAPARRSGWYVQVSAVRTREAGNLELRRLARVDYQGVILQESGLYKVRAGPFATRNEAASALAKIKARLGGSPFVTRVP
jgi:cell division septation protein DedD